MMFVGGGSIQGEQSQGEAIPEGVRDDLPVFVHEEGVADVGVVGEGFVEQVMQAQEVVEQDRVGGARREVTRDRDALLLQLCGHGGRQRVARLEGHARAEQENKSKHDAEDFCADADRASKIPKPLNKIAEDHGVSGTGISPTSARTPS